MEGRFEALHGAAMTALVGREEELELLLRRWSRAKTGEGQVVLLSGEAGIGKSRLTAALLERLTSEPHTRLRYFCSPQHTDSAFYPIISQMERAAGFVYDDIPQARLDKLDMMLASTPKKDVLRLFAAAWGRRSTMRKSCRTDAHVFKADGQPRRPCSSLSSEAADFGFRLSTTQVFDRFFGDFR